MDRSSTKICGASTMAPAFLICRTMVASCSGFHPSSASDPPVVCRPTVSKLSFTIMGMQCIGPVGPPVAYRLSSESATASASGFTRTIALMAGPRLSRASMRSRYAFVSARQVSVFALKAAWIWAMVASSRRNGRRAGWAESVAVDVAASSRAVAIWVCRGIAPKYLFRCAATGGPIADTHGTATARTRRSRITPNQHG